MQKTLAALGLFTIAFISGSVGSAPSPKEGLEKRVQGLEAWKAIAEQRIAALEGRRATTRPTPGLKTRIGALATTRIDARRGLDIGMTREQVRDLLGDPSAKSTDEGKEEWTYTEKELVWLEGKKTAVVTFSKGRLKGRRGF